MSPRHIAVMSAGLGLLGVLTILLSWTEAIGWEEAEAAGFVLVALSLFLIGLGVLISLARVSKDMALIRDRTSSIATNVNRTAERVTETRDELVFGSYSHVPGQVARIEVGVATGHEPTLEAVRPEGATTPNEVFDRVYVLNLAADMEKLSSVGARLSRVGIEFERFDAIDGNDPKYDEEWHAYVESELSLPQERHLGEHLIESRGAWGYLKTMHALLTRARNDGLRSVLVFDDDVMLHRRFGALFGHAWVEVRQNWKLVYLGSVQARGGKRTEASEHLYHPGGVANGSYAVAINASAFDQLITAIERMDMPFDSGALREVDEAFPNRVLAADPPLAIADVGRSAIRTARDPSKHALKHGLVISDYTT